MDNLNECTKEELIAQIRALKAHNLQLQNIIAKNSKSNSQSHKDNRKKPFDFQKCRFRHVLLKFLYLGWDYQGYVTQEDTTNTIEHHLFKALLKTCLIKSRADANYHRCGRTDKGVSAFSQVISINVRSHSDDVDREFDYCKILNRVLPNNIQFIAWCPVEDDFSARFDCKKRTYKYFFPKANLDMERIKEAAGYLVGTHDFRNFCKMDVNNGVVEFKRNILSVDVKSEQDQDTNYSMCVFTIVGNAFLWHQIRCIVGLLLLIGERKEQPELIAQLLDVEANPRKPEYYLASEIPLNLYESFYENVEWIYSPALNCVIEKLYQFCTLSTIKSEMVKQMISSLEANTEEKARSLDFLIQGVKSKNYIPVMKRQLCASLEDKIENSLNRSKRKKAA